MSSDLSKADLFRKLGFGGDGLQYEQALEKAGLSRPGKLRVSLEKKEQVVSLLKAAFVPVCVRSECQSLAARREAGRVIAPAASPTDCEICRGSINALAVAEMVRDCGTVGWRRLCIVGGSPNTTSEFASLVGDAMQLRLIDGTTSRTRREAESDMGWADRVIIWGSTELAHKVSALYKGPHVITAARRGVSELAKAVSQSAARTR